MNDSARTRLNVLLDLLADEVAERLAERREAKDTEPEPPRAFPSLPATIRHDEALADVGDGGPKVASAVAAASSAPEATPMPAPEPPPETAAEATPELALGPVAATASHTAPLLARLALGVFIIVALINVPLNAQGMALARSIPSSASLVIRNGLLVQETTSPDVWVYRDGAFHWITSLDAFQHFGYRWENVRAVEPGFLDRFEKGTPLSVLLKCGASPHVYALEGLRKRWIVDIATFEAEGYVWKDVKSVDCAYLRDLPDGESIPPGRGTPPPPLP